MIKLLLFLLAMTQVSYATINIGYVPVSKTTGSAPSFQQGSLYDTGSSSGAGNVGVGTTNPGQKFDVNGTVRAIGFANLTSGNVGIGTSINNPTHVKIEGGIITVWN